MAILVLAAIVPSVLTAVTIMPSAAFAISDSRKNSNTVAPQDESITRGAEPQTDHKLPTCLGVAPISRNIAALGDK